MTTTRPTGGRVLDVDDDGDVIDPNRLSAEIEEFGIAWAKAKKEAQFLRKTESSVLAELTNQQRGLDPALSRREAEDLARASSDFREHQYAAIEAEYRQNVARARYDAARAKFEAIRSAEATRRVAMQSYR